MSYSGKTVVVIGLGKSGAAATRLLLRRGARVIGLDENPAARAPVNDAAFTLRAGPITPEFWRGADEVVVSPGVPLLHPALVAARAAGVPLYGEIELAWRTLPQGAGPILGITGTNGKSTTTALLGELVKQHQPRTFVGGNLGTPFTCAYEDPATPPYAVHVIELSSFQLEGLVDTRVHGAAILNLTPDHLDRYPSHQAYGLAKARIFERQPNDGFAVINGDDAALVGLAARAHVPVYAFTRDSKRTNPGSGLTLGSKDKFMLMFAGLQTFALRNRALRGDHNLENAMAAATMAHLAGVPAAAIQAGLDAFAGLPHRLEFVRELAGVEWLNDSKATNVESALVALHALEGPVWLIAGGKGKGAPYAPLVEAAHNKVKGVLTIGQDAGNLAAAFSGVCAVHPCQVLEAAVRQARALAVAGDTVLLSPACASYDQFNNFEHRGDAFKSLVKAL